MWKKFKQQLTNLFLPHVGQEAMRFNPRTLRLNNTEVVVRQATFDIIPEMVAVEKAIYGFAPWDEDAFALELRHKRRLYLVAESGPHSQVVAFAGLSVNDYESESHITNIGVLPTYQRQGLGSSLLNILITVSRECGMSTMSLEVRSSNHDAQRLYERLGFKKTRLRHKYYVDNGEDAYEMNLNLEGEAINHDSRQVNPGI